MVLVVFGNLVLLALNLDVRIARKSGLPSLMVGVVNLIRDLSLGWVNS